MKNSIIYLFSIVFIFQSCIGDDVIFDTVEPEIRIITPIDTLEIGTSFTFKFSFFNNVGQIQSDINPTWSSSDPTVISINQGGTAFAEKEGSSIISVEYVTEEKLVKAEMEVAVGKETIIINTGRSGTIRTTSSYALSGDFTLEDNGSGGITINFAENFNASTALPGLYVYLTNNPNTTSGAKELQKVTTFQGAHSIDVSNTDINAYSHILYFCKPFNVKVGDGEIQ